MNKIYLNELSLEGQFREVDDFLDAALPVMKCLKFVTEKNMQINKHSTFYSQKITKDKTWNDLRGMRGDKVRRMKSLLLSTTDTPPYWDCQPELKQDLAAEYIYEGNDITATSLAEAAEDKGILLSFPHEAYDDRILKIVKDKEIDFAVPSAGTLKYLAEQLRESRQISFQEYLCARYEGTRLDFQELESEYGFQNFEEEEIRDCIQTFDKFVQMDKWNDIFSDRGLHYKKYAPASDRFDWFREEKYADKTIDKFRCINPKRCFGYREEDIFHVLRMERDHKISDHG